MKDKKEIDKYCKEIFEIYTKYDLSFIDIIDIFFNILLQQEDFNNTSCFLFIIEFLVYNEEACFKFLNAFLTKLMLINVDGTLVYDLRYALAKKLHCPELMHEENCPGPKRNENSES